MSDILNSKGRNGAEEKDMQAMQSWATQTDNIKLIYYINKHSITSGKWNYWPLPTL